MEFNIPQIRWRTYPFIIDEYINDLGEQAPYLFDNMLQAIEIVRRDTLTYGL